MILCVGLVCIDVIFEVDGYPKEDSDQVSMISNSYNCCKILLNISKNKLVPPRDAHFQRVLAKRIARGGNEANICQVRTEILFLYKP